MHSTVVIGADLGASSGKTAKGTFDGDRLIISAPRSFVNRPVDIHTALYWNVFGLYQAILDEISYFATDTVNFREFLHSRLKAV